jgi:hypothetical protein
VQDFVWKIGGKERSWETWRRWKDDIKKDLKDKGWNGVT